jgi:hypothetical protein
MCYGCWEDEGKPVIDTPAVRAATASVALVYEHSCVGGNLHIVLDDWNLDDGNLAFCEGCIDGAGQMPGIDTTSDVGHQRYNEKKRAHPDPPAKLAAERRCLDLFKALSEKERASALALYDGFWSVAPASERPETPDEVGRR